MITQIVLLVAVSVLSLSRGGTLPNKQFGRVIPDGRIVGGHDADIADYPYQLALCWHGGFLMCGASLIDSKWAVTSARCTNGSSVSYLEVIAGSSNLKSGQVVQVAAVYQHPKFDYATQDYDISILELEEDVTIETASPIALHDAGYVAEEGADVTITGFGVLYVLGPVSDVLQVITSKVVSNEVCNEAYRGGVTDRMACTGNDGVDTCAGDEGGPTVVDGKLYGIIIWGTGCTQSNYPGTNTRISEGSIRDFIRNVTGI